MTITALERAEARCAGRPFELRAQSDDGGYDLEGYAALVETPYEVEDFLGEYTEVIRAGAFKRTLDHGADVRLLINHDGIPLARTKSGTMSLEEDGIGLLVRAGLDKASPQVQSVKSAIDRRDADQMSFMFRVTRQEWSPDFTQRDILEVQLFDVSVVTFPANEGTSVSLRSASVARWGEDVWGRIERHLRTGEHMPDDVAAVYARSLQAAGIDPAPTADRSRWLTHNKIGAVLAELA